MLSQINEEYYFDYIQSLKKIRFIKYKNNKHKFISSFDFEPDIFSLYHSKNCNQIYACLAQEKQIRIIEYKIIDDKNEMKLNIDVIKDDKMKKSHFNKCIDISNKNLASCDWKYIYIWEKKTVLNKNLYSIKSKIIINAKTIDLLLINDDYFISAQPNNRSITFINIDRFSIEKIIYNIDCICSTNCLLLFKEYIIVNCKKGLAILSNKTKEYINYIELVEKKHKNKIISCNDNFLIVCNILTPIIYISLNLENIKNYLKNGNNNGEYDELINEYINEDNEKDYDEVYQLINDDDSSKPEKIIYEEDIQDSEEEDENYEENESEENDEENDEESERNEDNESNEEYDENSEKIDENNRENE